MKTILFCGGHVTPALAVIEKLQHVHPEYRILYVGRKHALEGDASVSFEYQTIQDCGITFIPLITGRLQRSFTIHTIPSLFKIPLGFFQSMFILLRYKPDAVLSFGGYVALPVCIAAFLFGIPTIMHEQTRVLGLSNKFIHQLSRFTCLSFADTQGIQLSRKTVVTGNPARESIDAENHTSESFGDQKLPLLFITGGSLGSRAINEAISAILPQLVSSYRVVHQCGNAGGKVDFLSLSRKQIALPSSTRNNYRVLQHIPPELIGPILKEARLVISRSGANTVQEIAAIGVPAILIPLPWSAGREQEENARLLEKIGLAVVLDQEDVSGRRLLELIKEMDKNRNTYLLSRTKARALFHPDAAKAIIRLIDTVMK